MTLRKGLCPTCGRVQPTWTPQNIINAIQAHYERHRCLPSERDWRKSGHDRPTSVVVRKVFGSWNTGIMAAGFEPRPFRDGSQRRQWTRDLIVDAIFQWKYEHGRLPRANEWSSAPAGYPSEAVVRYHFGRWNAALEHAGYRPTMKRAA